MSARKSLPDIIRDAIRRDSRTPYRLSEESGVARAVLSRFIRGERDLNLRTADRLCQVLGLGLRPVRRRGTKGD